MQNLWRKIHFFCTLIAGLFILIAVVTGCVLAVEPWLLSRNAVSGPMEDQTTFPEFKEKLGEHFLEIFSLEQDAYGNLKVEGIHEERDGTMYVHARRGDVVAAPGTLHPVFDFSRDLHRSLFLKTPGRILVGLASLAMLILTVSGIGLHFKRAGGWKGILKRIRVQEMKRDGHALWSRLFWALILILATTGVCLSVIRFVSPAANQQLNITGADFPLDRVLLRDIRKVTFPVDADEPLIVETTDHILHYENGNGVLLQAELLSSTERFRLFNFWLHTGEGLKYWAVLLGIASVVLLFLVCTGFQMVVDRWRHGRSKEIISADADTYILVGSETHHTWRFARALQEALQAVQQPVNLLGMEHLPQLTGTKTLYVLSSTYGDGDAPENARNVLSQLEQKLSGADRIRFSVLGFGSRDYPAFCAFAEQLHEQLRRFPNTEEIVPFMTVDKLSIVQFVDWVKALNKRSEQQLNVATEKLHPVRRKKQDRFQVLDKKEHGDTFLLEIRFDSRLKIRSGDLIGVYPPQENIERFYSIAVLDDSTLMLVVKRTGKCSEYLGQLASGQTFEGYIKTNPGFHLPDTGKPVLMIANGTGIAPFLGMQAPGNWLYWGGKYEADFDLFKGYFQDKNYKTVFSRERDLAYVQDLILPHETMVATLLRNQGLIMICGSLTMLKGVEQQIELVATRNGLPSVDTLKKQGLIMVDCY